MKDESEEGPARGNGSSSADPLSPSPLLIHPSAFILIFRVVLKSCGAGL